ncbi:hypothetical protein Fmac_021999 [Flemingia macrophylla]|uniref:DUF7895 domain-containing protein n=1 Tax=Flemingia macrophylla TaxID=520843 RepID=A0ABD1LYF9_9FABA
MDVGVAVVGVRHPSLFLLGGYSVKWNHNHRANSLLSLCYGGIVWVDVKLQLQRRRISTVSYALAETAASVAVAVTVVGAAATLLVKRSKTSESTQIQFKACVDCGGSGICSECKGEGFVLRKRSEESAEKARVQAKNMATRFTAGLPKKWSYCTKCSSGRSCSTCGGSGKLSY